MEIHLNTANFLVIIGAIILLIFIFSIFKKLIRTIFILIIVASLAFYVFVYSDMLRNPDKHAKYSIEYLKDKYCENLTTHKDSVRCEYIITPIYNDIKARYSDQELKNFERDPVKYFKILKESIKRNKNDIVKNLTKDKEQQMWDDFVQDLRKDFPNLSYN